MTKWKIGDRAMVEIAEIQGRLVALRHPDEAGRYVMVTTNFLHPLPAPDPLTDLERAVVVAAEVWEKENIFLTDIKLRSALSALRAARTQSDPMQELLVAAKYYHRVTTTEGYDRLKRAIAAVEAREKGK